MINDSLKFWLILALMLLTPKYTVGDKDGYRDINVSDIQVQAMARRAMRRVNEMTTRLRYSVPLEIVSAKQQTNQFGTETILKMKIQDSTCPISVLYNDAPHPSCVPFKYGLKELVTVSVSTLPGIDDEMVNIISRKQIMTRDYD